MRVATAQMGGGVDGEERCGRGDDGGVREGLRVKPGSVERDGGDAKPWSCYSGDRAASVRETTEASCPKLDSSTEQQTGKRQRLTVAAAGHMHDAGECGETTFFFLSIS